MSDWGRPAFAKDYPEHPELAELVEAFANGNYALVRQRAPKLIANEELDEAIRKAAGELQKRTEPDPTSRLLFLVAAGLLAFLTFWWVSHKEPHSSSSSPQPKKVKAAASAAHS